MVVRLGIFRRRGLVVLVKEEMGWWPAAVLCATMIVLGAAAIVSELSGVVAVGELFGLGAIRSCAVVVLSGDYAMVERVGLALGGCLSVFVVTALLCRPSWEEVALSVVRPSVGALPPDVRLAELVLANLGTVVTPWMLFYQASAIVEKRLSVGDLPLARFDTLLGSVVAQLVMCAVLITFAAQARGLELDHLGISQVLLSPMRPLLGEACTQVFIG